MKHSLNFRLRAFQLFALLGVFAALAVSCNPRGARDRAPGGECFDAGDCTADEGEVEACINGYCDVVDCLQSTDCPIGTFCDIDDEDFTCQDGCEGDGDCLAGSSCLDGTCEQYACRSTVLDCDFGEFCDEDSGECVEAEGAFCAVCDPVQHINDDGGTLTTCDDLILGHPVCGNPGGFCLGAQGDSFCTPPCETQEDCPAGYQCGPITRGLPAGCADDFLLLGMACVPSVACQ